MYKEGQKVFSVWKKRGMEAQDPLAHQDCWVALVVLVCRNVLEKDHDTFPESDPKVLKDSSESIKMKWNFRS